MRRSRQAWAEEMEAFRAAVAQKPCAMCGQDHEHIEAHHVVERRHLPADQQWHPSNALPLCGRFSTNGCHERHTNRSRPVPFRKLRADNVAYAYRVLGAFAGDYLKRYPMDEEK